MSDAVVAVVLHYNDFSFWYCFYPLMVNLSFAVIMERHGKAYFNLAILICLDLRLDTKGNFSFYELNTPI